MKFNPRQLAARPGLRYLVVGGGVYVFELVVIIAAQSMAYSPVVSVAASYILGTLLSFGLQKLFTFNDRRLHHKIVIPQLVATSLLVLFNFGFTLLLTKLLSRYLPVVVCRTLALGITTIWNFYLYKTHIFKNSVEIIT